MAKQGLPTHDIDHSDLPVRVRPLVHQNSYDFTKVHRHAYYEIIIMEQGGGRQQIDFEEFELLNHSCFLIHPHQVHLLERAPQSSGLVIQFEANSIEDQKLIRVLREHLWLGNSPLVIDQDQQAVERLIKDVTDMRSTNNQGRYLSDIMRNRLQALLYDLLSRTGNEGGAIDQTLKTFLALLEQQFNRQHGVAFYVEAMSVSDKALSAVTKQYLGLTPLQVIHQRLVLEAKRRLAFDDQTHKAIAFDLGFETASSFSAFVKAKTGQTPSQLQQHK